jgi:23S rRNA pseudouridine2457 synthase
MTSKRPRRTSSKRYILLYKPYGILSQFTPENDREGLASLGQFPRDVYAAGRLDADSEGLLLLTNDGRVIYHLTDPRFAHPRTYLAELEGVPDMADLEVLSSGTVVKGRLTKLAQAELLEAPPDVPPRPVPVRFRKNVPTSWIRLTLHEGRNRQVRRMTASVGHPTLRLIRIAIGPLSLAGLAPGEHRDLQDQERSALFAFLGLVG